MNDIALIRSMTNKEGEHERATYQLHTGYIPTGTVRHPSLGAAIAKEMAAPNARLARRRFGRADDWRRLPRRRLRTVRQVQNAGQLPRNSEAPVATARCSRRLGLFGKLEDDSPAAEDKSPSPTIRSSMGRPRRWCSLDVKAFEIRKSRRTPGRRTAIRRVRPGCLLARRLVEAGVTFVEVRSRGWDTHDDNFNRGQQAGHHADPGICGAGRRFEGARHARSNARRVDGRIRAHAEHQSQQRPRPLAQLVQRGDGRRRDSGGTGDRRFDRRRHGGQERPVTVPDLFSTICESLKVDPQKETSAPSAGPSRSSTAENR